MSMSRPAIRVAAAVAAGLVGAAGLYAAQPLIGDAPAVPGPSRALPGDVDTTQPPPATDFDVFSWQSFVAINSPPGSGTIGGNGDNVTVWESAWMSDYQILDSSTPPPWGTAPTYPQGCEGGIYPPPPGTRVLAAITKGLDLASSALGPQHATTPGNGPLIDQNGNYVRFEILVNHDMYQYIVSNELYTKSGQSNFAPGQPISFPLSQLNGSAEGAIMLKVAWKIMGAHDVTSQFHMAHAFVKDDSAAGGCKYVAVGLVGLHISRKTQNFPKWIWSTFEHQANAPTAGQTWQGPYNFNDGNAKADRSTWNQVPVEPWKPSLRTTAPVEVVRLIPVTSSAGPVNTAYGAVLRAVNQQSVFANYQLVGTQRPTDNNSPNDAAGDPEPQFLANTTMETFLQGDAQGNPAPGVTSNCGECHAAATMTDMRPGDFTYILSRVTAP